MCLNTITKKFNPPDPTEREAWKIVTIYETGFDNLKQTHIITPFQYTDIHFDVWMQSPQSTLQKQLVYWYGELGERPPESDTEYLVGFHVFVTKEEAIAAKKMFPVPVVCVYIEHRFVIPVRVRNVTYEGTDASTYDGAYLNAQIKTLVAEEMYVSSEALKEKI